MTSQGSSSGCGAGCGCGCCAGTQVDTPVPVANRPGLPAIADRAGDYGGFLSSMRARLSSPAYPALARLTARDTGDPAIALLDGWAIVADVLTFYTERLANEVKGPVVLNLVEEGNHIANNRAYCWRTQSADWMAEQLGVA